jgi:hypothetical protein
MLEYVAWAMVALSAVGWGVICAAAANDGEMGPIFITWGFSLLWAVIYLIQRWAIG